MTLLVDNSSRPGTHALVIGIGRYPWLVGGKSKPRFALNDGMSQLTSPPASARAIAAWLLDSFDNPNAPLASLDLLLSDEEQKFEDSGRAVEVEPATFENVSKAIKAWAKRSTREEDLLLFFFSGHGISAALQTTLLCENYGSDTLAPLSHAIDFTKLHIGLDRVAARRQCFFVDACRVATTNVLDTFNFYGQPVVDPTSQHNPRPRQAPVFYSTLSGQLAYGRKGKPSYFTEALLRGLQGPGSDDNLENDSSWWVRADALLRALPALLQRVAKPGEILQQTPGSDITDLPLHRLKARPSAIPVDVSCAPEARTGKAVLSWSGEGKNQERKKPSPDPWRVDLDAGRYTFKARVSTPEKEGELANESIRPPFRKIRISL